MNESEEPKIIVDEDFKAQVEREKEQLRQKSAPEETEQPGSENLDAPPPASMSTLISMLTTQALVAMGRLAIPGESPSLRLDFAKYYIDLLDILEEKTRRNLVGHEADLLKSSLYQLRMLYVEVNKKPSDPG